MSQAPIDAPTAAPVAAPVVVHSESEERFQLVLDDEVIGFLDYMNEDGQRVLTHTVVEAQYGGRGYAALLVTAALTDIRAQGLKVVPVCSYVDVFLQRHSEWSDIALPAPRR